ncbi:MAG: prolyl aminopeptidase, partial [Nitrosomonadales bacterium]|nr:prolyl aminopeptidase [Nitrosomonadales bacterium]
MADAVAYNLYPEIDSYHSDWLKVSQTHAIYYEECGNPSGKPVLFLHGGPGSGCNPNQRRFFDPTHYRIILLDQRGCGRSLPLGETSSNTIDDLVDDIDKLRQHLNMERWLVFGGSWGSTLGMAYAIAHAENVSGLILRGIFLSRDSELKWFLGDTEQFFPEAWSRLLAYLEPNEHGTVLEAYAKRIFSDDLNISAPAATRWNEYESSIMSLRPNSGNGSPVTNEVQVARARVQIHYILHGCFVKHRNLLEEAKQLAHIPTIIVQGRYDMVCPPTTAWLLKQAMPHAEFHMIPDAGHSAMEPGTCAALVAATEQFKS